MLHIFHRSSDEDYGESSEEDDDDDEEEEEEEEEPLLDYKSFQKTNKKEADFWSHEAVDDVVKKYEAKELTAARAGEELLARPVCEWRAKNSVTAIAATIRRLRGTVGRQPAAVCLLG